MEKVRHLVFWNIKGESEAEKARRAAMIKNSLEGLRGLIPGVIEINVYRLSNLNDKSSTREIMLDSLFESREALENYQGHPEHKKAGVTVVENTEPGSRVCADYYSDQAKILFS